MNRKKIAVLGCTGSVGSSALAGIAKFPEKYEVVSLTAHNSINKIKLLAERFKPAFLGITDDSADVSDLLSLDCKIGRGADALKQAAEGADIVLLCVVGIAGLPAFEYCLKRGIPIALATKEAMVCGGAVARRLMDETGTQVLPVDSELSAIFQCLNGEKKSELSKILLTASGGPFRTWDAADIPKATVEQALKHPNWSMGAKITVDSASMINKGLEIMETRWLFDVPRDKIEVVVHPQSIIHSMVEYKDGCVMAQMATPDMTLPIMYAFSYPEREENVCQKLDLFSVGTLTFEKPDLNKFPCLALAYEAAAEDGALQLALNSANEIAVAEFLRRNIPFGGIARVVEASMNKFSDLKLNSFEDIYQADLEVRSFAREFIARGGAISQSFQQIFH